MDRKQLLLVGLPLFLFCSDIIQLFTPPPHKPAAHHHPSDSRPLIQHQPPPLEFPTQKDGGIGYGNTVSIDFCSSCSYRGTAVTMKNMLESQFPGMHVVLANYPPPLPKRLLSKVVPIIQFGAVGIMLAGEQIFPRLGFAAPPQWYYSMRANRFGSMASIWLLGNFLQSFLQSSGAFEVYCNGELAGLFNASNAPFFFGNWFCTICLSFLLEVFSKLKESRFPGEIELKDLVGRRIANSRVMGGL